MICCQRRAPPLRVDPHTLARKKPATLETYRLAVASFLEWCNLHNVSPDGPQELDDLHVEWKNVGLPPKSRFAACLAGCELVIPGLRHQLPWAKAVYADWVSVAPISHHKPLPLPIALLLAVGLALCGYCRLGAGLVIAQVKGLRPSEILKLRGRDATTPDGLVFGRRDAVVLNLGARTGTELKRAQACIIRRSSEPIAFALAVELALSTPAECFLMGGIDLNRFNALLTMAQSKLSLSVYTGHSARAGFASDGVINGQDFVTLREEGRWTNDATLRVYLDVVSTAVQATHSDVRLWANEIHYLEQHFLDVLPRWPNCPSVPTREVPKRLRCKWTK